MVAGFALRPSVGAAATPALAAGGVLSALGAYAFAYGLWRTIDGPAALRRAAARARGSSGRPLPVSQSGG
jgi:hypothetical protein